MHYALTRVGHVEFGNAEVAAILVKGLDLQTRHRVGDTLGAVGSGHVVVGSGEVGVDPPQLAPGLAQPLEGLGAGHLVHQLAIYIK